MNVSNKKFLQGVNLYLVGMMGAGKTTVGELLSQNLGYRFLDTDNLISQVAGKSINEIFADDG
ncbi:MAG: AAA family ATPase, partial [Okeania sp. SIO2H7]|nr:AAA family ATPase [Okeania sp. SIO2H7]